MKWIRLDASLRKQPTHGGFSEWKPLIAATCNHRCVYCGIHESRYGGIDNFHVDHYRPKSISKFAGLANDIDNLYLACAICNRFKSNDWPNDPAEDHGVPAYPDPCKCAYVDLFIQSTSTFRVEGKFIDARYVVERLGLNRTQLIIDRRLDALMSRWDILQQVIDELILLLENAAEENLGNSLILLLKALKEAASALQGVFTTSPYLAGDTKKALAK